MSNSVDLGRSDARPATAATPGNQAHAAPRPPEQPSFEPLIGCTNADERSGDGVPDADREAGLDSPPNRHDDTDNANLAATVAAAAMLAAWRTTSPPQVLRRDPVLQAIQSKRPAPGQATARAATGAPGATGAGERPGPGEPSRSTLPALPEGGSLRGVLTSKAAHLSVDTAAGERLTVRISLNDAVAHVRIEGAAAPALGAHADQLRTALAAMGLSLGKFQAASSAAPQRVPAESQSGVETTSEDEDDEERRREHILHLTA